MRTLRQKRYLLLYPLYLLTLPALLLAAGLCNLSAVRADVWAAFTSGLACLALAFVRWRMDRALTRCGGKRRRLKRWFAFLRAGRRRRLKTVDRLLKSYAAQPTEFEAYVAEVYRRLGYAARVTPRTGDGGIDVWLRKNGVSYAVEVKLYARGHLVGREYIQKLWAAQMDAGADVALFVTTSGFSAQAVGFAARHAIGLIDGEALEKLIRRADRAKRG